MNSQQSNFQPRETHLTMLKFIKTGNSGNVDSLKGPRNRRGDPTFAMHVDLLVGKRHGS
jgi:hypothetical protein